MSVIFCVGSNKVVSDSFGAFVGTMLKNNNCKDYVYGSIDASINGLNLDNYIELLNKYHKKDNIIVVDTKLVFSDEKIKLSYGKGKIVVSPNLRREIGDYHLTLNIPIKQISKVNLGDIVKYSNQAYHFLKKLKINDKNAK